MKTKVTKKSYDDFLKVKAKSDPKPRKTSPFFRWLLKTVAASDLKDTNYKANSFGMEKLKDDEPCFILMNHSSFIDLEMVTTYFSNRSLSIICTADGFVGKHWLLERLGCISTKKFITDYQLVKKMKHCLNNLKTSILMYPEASYTFDGTATHLPKHIGKCIKNFKVPLISITTHGAFIRQPLYNELRKRKVDVSMDVKYLLSKEDIENMSADEIQELIEKEYQFDNFLEQKEKGIIVDDEYRAQGLDKILYKCPHCKKENMGSEKINLFCKECGATYRLNEDGSIENNNGESLFNHIPSYFKWEREEVRKEILEGTYNTEFDCVIMAMKDSYHLYEIGKGHLIHNNEGFHLVGCDDKLDFKLKPHEMYSCYSDYYWYSIGDLVSIGNANIQFYCFPEKGKNYASRVRLATEELYKIATKRDS